VIGAARYSFYESLTPGGNAQLAIRETTAMRVVLEPFKQRDFSFLIVTAFPISRQD
jgi:hypothetical protein